MPFERIRYPDGQIGAKRVPLTAENLAASAGSAFLIQERINSYEDLFYVRSIAEIIQNTKKDNTSRYTLLIPCMFGQRSDRRFGADQSFDLKLIAEVINNCKFGEVQILDPHSDVSLALIENSRKLSSFYYVEQAIKHYHNVNAALHNYSVDPILVSPDAGAYKKVFDYGEKLGLEVVAAVKHRGKEGKVDLTFMGDVKDKVCFIIDDLCDGGYTFLVLADALRKQGAREVYLYVTHGLFSKGFVELRKQVDHIYCTNSVSDLNTDILIGEPPNLNVVKWSDYVTQFKVI